MKKMYAREYAQSRGYPYAMILHYCKTGELPSLRHKQKYLLVPEEADAAIERLKREPKEPIPKASAKAPECKKRPAKIPYLELLKQAL